MSVFRAPLARLSSVLACVLSLCASFFSEAKNVVNFGSTTVPFAVNAGQWDDRVSFAAQTFAGTAFVTRRGELVYSLPAPRTTRDVALTDESPKAQADDARTKHGWTLVERFVDSRGTTLIATPNSMGDAVSPVSYFIGEDAAKHRTSVPAYEKISFGEVFPSVNVHLRATGRNVEKIFTVAPNGDPTTIRLSIDGDEGLTIGRAGELLVATGNGEVAYTAPIAFQTAADGSRESVDVAYALNKDEGTYGFVVGAYDRSRPLVIDPLLRSTYVGGSGDDFAYAAAVHPISGEIYVAGETFTTGNSFPGVLGGAQPSNGGGKDVFIARFSADLTQRLQATYLGGLGDEYARAIAINPTSGDVYIAGDSESTTFPGVGCAVASSATGSFVSRLNANLTSLLCTTRFGSNTRASSLAIRDANSDVYVAGTSYSAFPVLPLAAGGAQATNAGRWDGFVARLDTTVGTILQSTYVGGTDDEEVDAIALNQSNGDVYVAGKTNTRGSSLPFVSGAAQGSYGGGVYDGFVTRFNPSLTSILRSTYLGSAGWDEAHAIAIVSSSSDIVVAGETSSGGNSFPGVTGGAQPTYTSSGDAFVSRLSGDLSTVVQSTYVSGPSPAGDVIRAMVLHPTNGEVYVTGESDAITGFPGAVGGAQATGAGNYDGFLSRLAPSLTAYTRSTMLGRSQYDSIRALAVDPTSGDIVAAGYTRTAADAFPGVTGSAQPIFGGATFDAFVSRFTADLTFADVTPDPFFFYAQGNAPLNGLRTSNPVQITGIAAPARISIGGVSGSAYCVSTNLGCTCNVSGGWITTSGTIANNLHVCVRHTASTTSNQFTESVLTVDTVSARFIVSTGSPIRVCNLDIDGDLLVSATKDWLVYLRASLGFSPNAAVQGTGITEAQWNAMRPSINANCGTNFLP
jgi:hypothetical protein